jgi:hypothetical protein
MGQEAEKASRLARLDDEEQRHIQEQLDAPKRAREANEKQDMKDAAIKLRDEEILRDKRAAEEKQATLAVLQAPCGTYYDKTQDRKLTWGTKMYAIVKPTHDNPVDVDDLVYIADDEVGREPVGVVTSCEKRTLTVRLGCSSGNIRDLTFQSSKGFYKLQVIEEQEQGLEASD